MSNKAVGWAFERDGLTLQSRMVLFVLADSADKFGKCWPSITTIVKCAGMSVRSVQRAIVDLEEREFISRAPRFDETGRQTSTLYQLPPEACSIVGKEVMEEGGEGVW